jgi:hypothetical protein
MIAGNAWRVEQVEAPRGRSGRRPTARGDQVNQKKNPSAVSDDGAEGFNVLDMPPAFISQA